MGATDKRAAGIQCKSSGWKRAPGLLRVLLGMRPVHTALPGAMWNTLPLRFGGNTIGLSPPSGFLFLLDPLLLPGLPGRKLSTSSVNSSEMAALVVLADSSAGLNAGSVLLQAGSRGFH